MLKQKNDVSSKNMFVNSSETDLCHGADLEREPEKLFEWI